MTSLGAFTDLDDDQRAQLAYIAERTPVTLTLKQGVPITTTVAASLAIGCELF
jgi:putative redox protein